MQKINEMIVEDLQESIVSTLEAITDGTLTVREMQSVRAAAKSLFDHADKKIVEAGAKSLKDVS